MTDGTDLTGILRNDNVSCIELVHNAFRATVWYDAATDCIVSSAMKAKDGNIEVMHGVPPREVHNRAVQAPRVIVFRQDDDPSTMAYGPQDVPERYRHDPQCPVVMVPDEGVDCTCKDGDD